MIRLHDQSLNSLNNRRRVRSQFGASYLSEYDTAPISFRIGGMAGEYRIETRIGSDSFQGSTNGVVSAENEVAIEEGAQGASTKENKLQV